jgi:V8-like Glu-specific endopeptidase
MTNKNPASNIDWSNFNSSLLIEVTRDTGVFTSSAVAINEDTILTAAHCLEGKVLKVRVFNSACYDPKKRGYSVKSFELHPDYDAEKSNYRNDIAKIKLRHKLPADTNFFPIMKKDNIDGKIVRLGFGARSDKNIRTMITPEFKKVRTHENVLELNDTYSYSGDSGGPVFLQQKGQMYLVAIHSTLSFGPDGKYSFNPLLSQHRDWIEDEVMTA